MTLRVFEAFAGYGSQSIALGLLAEAFPDFRFQTVGISEIDKYAIKAYAALHGSTIPNHGDITKIDWSQTADFDLLTYSFPCQDISSAGKQRGFSEGSGTRSSCLWACANAIEKKRPKFLLMENVKALTQTKFADDFRRWREWLIKQGYKNYYTILNAKDYGVPQNRERVFMVSFLGDHSPYSFPKPFELTRRLKHILEDEVEEKYWLKPEQIRAIINHNERKQSEGCGFKTNFQTGEGISGAIKTKEGSREYDTYGKVPTYGNSRLNSMIADGKIDPEEVMWIDCYNQRVDPDIAGTILARVNATGHYLVSDPRGCAMRGRPDASGRNAQQIELGSDIANALTSVQKDSMVAEPRVIQVGNLIEDSNYKNPHRGRVYSIEGIAPCLNCNEGGSVKSRYYSVATASPKEVSMTLRPRSPPPNGRIIILLLLSIGYANSLRANVSGSWTFPNTSLTASSPQVSPTANSINWQVTQSWWQFFTTSSARCSPRLQRNMAHRSPIAMKHP